MSSNLLWQPASAMPAKPPAPVRKNTIPGTWLTLSPVTNTTTKTDTSDISPTSSTSPASTSFLTNNGSVFNTNSSRHSSFDSPVDDMRRPLKSSVEALVGGDAAERREVNAALGRAIVEG